MDLSELARSRRVLGYGAAALLAVQPRPALAHAAGLPPAPDDLWAAWSLDPLMVLMLLSLGIAYGLGLCRLWRRAGRGRGVRHWQAVSFATGLAVLALALTSPLDGLGEALFSAHMAQHIILTAAVPPLLLLGKLLVLIWSLPNRARAAVGAWIRTGLLPRIWRWLARPKTGFVIEAAVLWGWHAPDAIHAALENGFVHASMHLSFLSGGLLLWEALAQTGPRRIGGYLVAAASSFLTMLHTGVLGALLTFAPRPLYTVYGERPLAWGLTPLEDQQLAGLLMWVVCGWIYMATALIMIGIWLTQLQNRSASIWTAPATAGNDGSRAGLDGTEELH